MTSPTSAFDVAIVGGGLVGCSLAVALTRARPAPRVVLIEAVPARPAAPAWDERCIALNAASRRILDAIGAWESLAGDAEPILSTHISERGRFGAARFTAEQAGLPALGYNTPLRAINDSLWSQSIRPLLDPREKGGYGLDAVWSDDLHHQLRRHVAGDHEAYFSDYTGSVEDIVRTLRQGWFYEGQESKNHGVPRGTPADGLPARAFVHCIQNHDQVGNRAFGDRLTESVPLPVYRAASALLLLSPYTPLLWMGQEWAATTPFQYFTDHPEELGKRVTEGRRKEFGKFSAFADPAVRERIPDPQAVSTFRNSKVRWDEAERMPHAGVRALYRELLRLRRTHPALRRRDRESFAAAALGEHGIALRRTGPDGAALLLVVSLQGALSVDLGAMQETRAPADRWELLLSSEEARFGGEAEGELVRLSPDGRLEMGGAGAVVLEGVGRVEV